MKKAWKIIGVILSMAIALCAVFVGAVIPASAAVSDDAITVIDDYNFNSAEVKTYIDEQNCTTVGTYPKIGGWTLVNNQGGTLKVVSGKNVDGSENRYAVLNSDYKVGTGGSYFLRNSGISAEPASSQISSSANNVSYRLDAYTTMCEADVYLPDGSAHLPAGSMLQFRVKYLDAGGAVQRVEGLLSFGTVYVNGIAVPSIESAPLDENSWNHISIALYVNKKTDSYDVNADVFVNGKYATTKTVGADLPYYTVGGVKHVSANLNEYRFKIMGTAVDASGAIAIDNFLLRHVNNAKDANKAVSLIDVIEQKGELSDWAGNVYSRKSMPFGTAIVTNTSTEKVYDSLQDAADEASANDTLNLFKSTTAQVFVDKVLSIATNKNSISISCGESYDVSYDSESGVYTVEKLSAVNNFKYIQNGAEKYTLDFRNALHGADKDSTITMLRDTAVDASGAPYAYIDTSVTIDLGGYSLEFYQDGQSGIYVSGNSIVNVINGTLKTTSVDSGYRNNSYSLFISEKNNNTLNLTNVDTYVGQLAVIWTTGKFTVNINGGFHGLTHGYRGIWGGFVESRTSMCFVANDATFFIDSSNWVVTQGYRAKNNNPLESTFTFNNCKLINDPSDPNESGFIKYANEYAKIYFNGCEIAGPINPTNHNLDVVYDANTGDYSTTKYGAIPKENIVFSNGTKFILEQASKFTVADSHRTAKKEFSTSYKINDCNDYPTDNGFSTVERIVNVTYDIAVEVIDKYIFKYTSGSKTVYGIDLVVALTSADAGTTVYFLEDFEIQTEKEPICYIQKNITVDLDGHSLTVYQEWQSSFYIQANVTFKNGEIRTVRTSDYKKEYTSPNGVASNAAFNNKSYPLFYMASPDKSLTLENITSYSGSLILSTKQNCVINIVGGAHFATNHDTAGAQGTWGGLIETRANTTVNVTGAILFADRSSWIVTSGSYYTDATNPKSTVYKFTDCKIISDPNDNDGRFDLVKYANENTKLEFNNCQIFGSINPTVYSGDKKGGANGTSNWGSIDVKNIVFGEGTRVAKGYEGIGEFTILGYSVANGGLELTEDAYTEQIVLKICNDNPYTEGYVFTRITFNLTYGYLVASKDNIAVTYHYPDGTVRIANYPVNTVITVFPTYQNPGTIDNGWVRIELDGGWSSVGYGEKLTSLTVTERVHLYPSATSAKAYLSSGRQNLTLYGNVGVNLLLEDIDSRPDGIVFSGVYDDLGSEIAIIRGGITSNGKVYDMYEISRMSVLEIDNHITVKVKFTYYGIEFVQTVNLRADRYVETTLLSSNTAPLARTLIADMVRYANAIYQYKMGDFSANCPIYEREITLKDGSVSTLTSVAALYSSDNGTADDFSNPQSLKANEYIKGISYDLGGADPGYVIFFKEGSRVVDVRVEMNGVWLSERVDAEIGNVSYGIDESQSVYYSGTKFLSVACTTGISVYNLKENVEIVVTFLDKSGARHTERISGSYNLASYYNGIKAGESFTADDIARAKAILGALHSYAESTALYRFGTTLDSDNVNDVAKNNVLNVYYEDFGAVADGVTDDFAAIQAAHEYANSQKSRGKFVTVYAIKPGGRISAGSTFFINNTNSAKSTFATSAVIKTDVDFTGAKFVINDYGIFEGSDASNPSYTKVERASNNAMYTPIFRVMPDLTLDETTPCYQNISYSGSLRTTDKYIEQITSLNLPFEYALVAVKNNNHGHYIRYGANASITVQKEVILVNTRTGEIDSSTPIVHDFLQVSELTIYDASEQQITIEGGEFETLYNRVNSYSYCKRGIEILRSNTVVKNLTHSYTYSAFNDKVSGGSPMHLFIGTENTYGVTIDSCTLEGPRRFWDTDNGNGTGTINRGAYSIRADYTASLAIKNITQTNFYTDDFTTSYGNSSDGMVDHGAIMGTNFCKNMLFEGNRMSTFDSHMDLYNLTFRNNEVERINIIGSGTVYIEDSLIHTGNTGAIVTLREDYNSNFKGDVYFKNVTVETYNNTAVALFLMTYYNYNTGLYYTDGKQYSVGGTTVTDSYHKQDMVKGDGDDSCYYTSYLPQNVYVDGLTVLSGGKVVTDSTKELGGTYTRGKEDTAVMLSLYTEYTGKSENKTQKLVHNWDCDISTYGENFTEGRIAVGSLVISQGTTYTVTNPIKPTENVYIDSVTYSKYTMHDYNYKGKAYDDLKFLSKLNIAKM